MSLKLKSIENIKYQGSRTIARCPACAEQGHDNKGNHLSIDEQGRYSCVMHLGEAGKEHRKRIYELIGIKNGKEKSPSMSYNKVIKVKEVTRNTGNVIKRDILGHLGRVSQTLKKHNKNDIKERIYERDFEKGVPNVPNIENELIPIQDETLRGLFLETMNRINDLYIPGTTRFIEENYPDIDGEINKADGRVNVVWKACNQGKAPIEDFKEALGLYATLYLKAIDKFKNKSVNQNPFG
jgi:hypothetical protein|tara:strand:+ start:335 stop:1051 length:717 start_codon:yes stop_codon:yes gene_type:complete